MGDLVVARERRVHRGPPAHHVRQHAEHDQVADEDAHRRAQERIDPAAVAAGADVAALLARGRDPLDHDLPEVEHEQPGDVEAVGEERAVAGVRALLGLDPADREDRVLGLAGEQVAAARAAVGEQPDAGRVAALDLDAVRGRGADHHRLGLLLDPAERGDVLVGAEQDAGLAGAGLRGQVGLPLGEVIAVVGDPARHRGRAAVAQRALEHGQREAVDLQVDDPRHVGVGDRAEAPGDPARDAQVVLVVVVGAADDLQDHADRGDHDRHQQRVGVAVHPDPRRERGVDEQQQRGVGRQQAEEADRDHEREPQRGQQRRDDRVQQRERERHHDARARAFELDAGREPGGDVHGGRQDGQRDEHAEQADLRCLGPPDDLLAIALCHTRMLPRARGAAHHSLRVTWSA